MAAVTWPNFSPSGSDPDVLPSRSTTSNIGWLPGGASGSDLSGGFDWGSLAKTGLGLLPSLFAGGGASIEPDIRKIQGNANDQLTAGKDLAGKGSTDLGPVLEYFKNLVSGNPNDVLAATAPDRRRVIDQYDTARRSSAQFTPRGGGDASSQNASRASEAGDIASLTASARSNAANSLGQLGESERNAGLTQEQTAQQTLASVLGPLFQQQQADQKSLIGTFTGLATMIAPFL